MNSLISRRPGLTHFTSGFSLNAVVSLYRQRRVLARLDDRALADIGITRQEAMVEAHRPFWDISPR